MYCSVLSLGGNVNTGRMSKPDMGSIFHIKNQWNILVIGNYSVNYQNYQNLMLLTSSDTKRTLMHLLLFTNSAQRELVSICTQSIHNRNWLSLPYILDNSNCLQSIVWLISASTINQSIFAIVLDETIWTPVLSCFRISCRTKLTKSFFCIKCNKQTYQLTF